MAALEGKPNPGSDAARALGCKCPIMDNNHGTRPGWMGGWIINETCPVHAGDSPEGE